ncbi:MAG: hypothetical protein PUG89_09450 [Succinivibrio sp.]|nr:hypothetical protein [Succinivibrio sp.]
MKNNKKSKIVLFSVIGLAVISIGTVGFATWITGVDSRTTTDTLTVNVDTSKNKTVIVEATLSDSDKTLSLTEPTTNIDQLIKVEEGKATDLTVTFSSFRVVVSDAYTLKSINFTLEGTNVENCTLNADNLSIYPNNLYGETSNSSNLSYLKIKKSIYDTETSLNTITSGQSGYIDGYTCYTLKEMAFTFSWGTMFGNGSQTPSEYLSTCDEAKSLRTTEDKLAYVEKCNKMLNAMHSNLDTKALTLTITANVTEKTGS